ncbi:MAG TPA: hypothetical protein VFZ93_12440 [Albitalea sp.]
MDMKLEDTDAPGRRQGHAPERPPRARPDVPGWGVDLDRKNRPAVPMERTPPRLDHPPPGEPSPQPLDIQVFHSSERPGVTPIFGTSVPPSGLSGRVRKVAFGYSENDIRHWMLLLFADRINVVEGLLGDLARGHVPRIYREMGGRAELKHNPAGAARKAAVVAAVAALAIIAWRRRATHASPARR